MCEEHTQNIGSLRADVLRIPSRASVVNGLGNDVKIPYHDSQKTRTRKRQVGTVSRKQKKKKKKKKKKKNKKKKKKKNKKKKKKKKLRTLI